MNISQSLQKWIYQTLANHEDLAPLLEGRIYDAPPLNKGYPCIVLGEENVKPWDTKTTKGLETRHTLHIFDSGQGFSRVKAIAGFMQAIFAQRSFEGEGVQIVSCNVIKTDTILEKNGIAHGSLYLRIVAQSLS